MTQNIKIERLTQNTGQVEGLPANPRFIRDEKFEALKKSLQDDPEILQLRELIVYPHGRSFVIIGGNMRFRAAEELGFSELPCKVLAPETSPNKLRAITIKDNTPYGQWDMGALADWNFTELTDWGVDTPFGNTPTDIDAFFEGAAEKAQEPKTIVCPNCKHAIEI